MIVIDVAQYVKFVVTGTTVYGKRFRKQFDGSAHLYTFGINLWNGSVWGVLPNGKRKLLKRASN